MSHEDYIFAIATINTKMKTLLRYRTLILLLLLMAGLSHPISLARPHLFRNLSEADGLADPLVNVIMRDSLHLTWLGTATTLECFDGIHLHHFPMPGPDNPRKRITALACSAQPNLWVGNGNGLYQMNHATGKLERRFESQFSSGVKDLLYVPEGGLYVATNQGLYILPDDDDKLQHILIQPNQMGPDNEINSLLLGSDRQVWIATNNGLHSVTTTSDGQRVLSHYYLQNTFEGDAPAELHCMAEVGDSILLGSHSGHILSFCPATGQGRIVSHEEGIPIMALQGVGQDSLYVATDGDGIRIRSLSLGRWVATYVQDGTSKGLTSNSVYSMLVDSDGLLWAGFYQQGLDYMLLQRDLVGIHNTRLFDTEGLAVRALAIHDEQRLFAVPGGLQFVDKERSLSCHFGYNELHAQMVFSLLYHEGLYYVGTYGGGLYTFDPRYLTLRPVKLITDRQARASQIFVITHDPDSTVWIGSDVGVFHLTSNGQSESFTQYNSQLPKGNVYEIYFDSTGRGWLCAETGMATYDPDRHAVRIDAFPPDFNHRDKIRIVFETRTHDLLFFPDKGSVFATDLSLHQIPLVAPVHSYIGSEGQCIIQDRYERLWIGGKNGLCYIDTDTVLHRVDFIDGLPSPVFNLCKPQLDEKGDIWLGNTHGLLYILPDSVELQPRPTTPAQVTNLLVNNRSIDIAFRTLWQLRHVDIEEEHPTLTFQFSDFQYTLPSCLDYVAILDGYDEQWQRLDGKAEITYYNLKWGNYTFRVRRPDDPSSETSLSIHVPIPKLVLLLLVGTIAGLLAVIFLVFYIARHRYAGRQLITVPSDNDQASDKYQAVTVSLKELRNLSRQLDHLMHHEKPYLNPNLRIGDLADKLGVSQYVLSYLFNQHLKIGYYDYVNNYRIEEFKQCVKNEDIDRYTLDALSLRCGFSSRTSFFRYFKKVSGLTPNEYIRQQRD